MAYFLDKYSEILRKSMKWVRVSVVMLQQVIRHKIVRPDKQGDSLFENLIDQMKNYAKQKREGIFVTHSYFLVVRHKTKDSTHA